MIKIKLLLLICCLISTPIFSAEKELEKEATLFDQTFNWQVMAGFSAIYNPFILTDVKQEEPRDFLAFSLLVDFYYKGFFLQSNDRRVEGLFQGGELGYQLLDKNDWALDIIAKPYLPGFMPDDIIKSKNKNIPSIEGLKDRNIGFGIGLRYSKYYDDAIFSFDLATLRPSTGRGLLADLYYSHLILYRNWDIYLGAGLTLYSDSIIDYYVGIDHDEVTPTRARYKARSGFRSQLEIFARHPISKSWTFNAGITQSYYSNAISNSPIVNKHNFTQIMLGAVYVF